MLNWSSVSPVPLARTGTIADTRTDVVVGLTPVHVLRIALGGREPPSTDEHGEGHQHSDAALDPTPDLGAVDLVVLVEQVAHVSSSWAPVATRSNVARPPRSASRTPSKIATAAA